MSQQGKSCGSGVVNFIAGTYLAIGAGIGGALLLHLMSVGSTLFSDWVRYMCVASFGFALALAIGKDSYRGLGLGAFLLVASAVTLGFGEQVAPTTDMATDGVSAINQMRMQVSELIATMFPVIACMVAIAFPLTSSPSKRPEADAVGPR